MSPAMLNIFITYNFVQRLFWFLADLISVNSFKSKLFCALIFCLIRSNISSIA